MTKSIIRIALVALCTLSFVPNSGAQVTPQVLDAPGLFICASDGATTPVTVSWLYPEGITMGYKYNNVTYTSSAALAAAVGCPGQYCIYRTQTYYMFIDYAEGGVRRRNEFALLVFAGSSPSIRCRGEMIYVLSGAWAGLYNTFDDYKDANPWFNKIRLNGFKNAQ